MKTQFKFYLGSLIRCSNGTNEKTEYGQETEELQKGSHEDRIRVLEQVNETSRQCNHLCNCFFGFQYLFLVFMGKAIHRLEMQVTNLSFGKEQGKEEALHASMTCAIFSLCFPFILSLFSIIFILSLFLASSFDRGGLAQLQGCTDYNMSLTARLMMIIFSFVRLYQVFLFFFFSSIIGLYNTILTS